MATLHKYRVYCSTESDYFETWDEVEPSYCPNNNGHTIDADKTSITQTVTSNVKRTYLDGKQWVHESSRPLGTGSVFTFKGDAITSNNDIKGGVKFKIVHTSGGADTAIYMDFNCVENETYIHEGYIKWSGADEDELILDIVPKTTDYTTGGTNTNYQLYNYDTMIIPADGDGTIVVDSGDIVLVECPLNMDTGLRPAGFWNADYSETTHTFSNITAASPAGTGIYNMWAAEIVMRNMVHDAYLGSGSLWYQSADSTRWGHGMRFRLTPVTITNDHDWKAICTLTMHRKKTC